MAEKIIKFSPDTDRCAEAAAGILNSGGVIIYPTETLYGIGALATDEGAIGKIFEIKKRAYGKPLLTLARDTEMIREFFHFGDEQERVYKKLNNFPLTVILDQKFHFPEALSAGTGKVGVRISTNEFVAELFNFIDVPLVSTSANISDQDNTVIISEIISIFSDKVDLIIDSGNLPVSKGSTVLDLTTSPPKVVRKGDISENELKELLIGDNQGI